MKDAITAGADSLRREAQRHKEAGKSAANPVAEEREKAQAKEDERKATEIENDLA